MRSLFRPLVRSAAAQAQRCLPPALSPAVVGHARLSSIPGRPLRGGGDGRRSRSRPLEDDPFPQDFGLGSDDDENGNKPSRRRRGDRSFRAEDDSVLGDFGGFGRSDEDDMSRARARPPGGRASGEFGGRPMRGERGLPGNRRPGGDREERVGRMGNADRQRFSGPRVNSSSWKEKEMRAEDDDDLFSEKLDIVGGEEERNAGRGGSRDRGWTGQMFDAEDGEDQTVESLELGDSMNGERKAKKSLGECLAPEADSGGPPPEADEIFEEMKKKGLIPNAVAMLDGLCKDGLVQEAMKLFGLMREKGTIPEVVIYTAVVEGFCKALKFDDAKRVFRKMQSNGIAPNAFSYKVLVQGLCKGKKLEDSVEFCVEMLEAGHSPNVVTFVGLIELVCSDKGLEEAMSVIKRLRDKGFAFEEKAVRDHLDKKGPFDPMVWEATLGKKRLHKLF